eukprot:CAMPEP_0117467714 /NCGR_PEP_ID=MMETSP0784-20121206/5798_1 /TAXON_ID=39447 /ORGANISM="" /LENGTH=550 /DNA_ID=CAMNT_0005261691 /DNA_START=41 /DNA_END=1690 /DNA_ORIENTATION=+
MLPGWMGWCPQLMSATPMLIGGAPGPAPASQNDLPTLPLPSLSGASTQEEQKEKERSVVVRALREIAEKKELEKKTEKPKEPAAATAKNPEEDADKKPRCHLHRKPNPKCKKCQQVLSSQSSANDKAEDKTKASDSAKRGGSPRKSAKDREKQAFNCSPMLKEQIVKSSYFRSLQEITTVEGLAVEISEYVDTLDVYNHGSKTEPSCFMCLVLRLSTLPYMDEDLHEIIDHRYDAKVRCVGFVYLRFVTAPLDLFEVFEEYLLDDMPVTYSQDGAEIHTTIGEYAEALLVKEKYFDSPLPRIPVKIRQLLEEKVAPMAQYRKRMQANRHAITSQNVDSLRVEANIDGRWVRGTANEMLNSHPSRTRIRVTLHTGAEIKVPLGKVVIRDDSDDSENESKSRKRRARSGSRSRHRDRSWSRQRGSTNDWSRFKGKSDSEVVEELRSRLRESAVCGHGKVYAKRPLTFDASMSSTALPHPVNEEKQDGPSSRRRRLEQDEFRDEEAARRKRAAEDERARQFASVYKKYCGGPQASAGAARSMNEVDAPDVLRL